MNAILARSLSRVKEELGGSRSKLLQCVVGALNDLDGETNAECNASSYYLVLKMVCESQHSGATVVALDCLQKLLAHGFLRGDERIKRPAANGGAVTGKVELKEQEEVALIDEVVETVCRCNNLTDDGVQLQVIKALLTAVTSDHATVNEESLLLAVRSCYNIHLVSHSIVNKTTAKATLTQMLSFVFQRMETADSELHLLSREEKRQRAYDKLQQAWSKVPKDPEASKDESKVTPSSILGAQQAQMNSLPTEHHKNAWLLFRSLCKLSMKDGKTTDVGAGGFSASSGATGNTATGASVSSTSSSSSAAASAAITDPVAIQSKALCLELLLSVLRSSGPAFRNSPKFLSAIRQYLCMSLLRNCTSNVQEVVDISLQVFVQLIEHFKDHLKSEIEVFITQIFLRILDSENSAFQHKGMVLEVLQKLCLDPVALVEIFVNYDADLESVDLFRQIVGALARCAKGGLNSPSGSGGYGDHVAFSSTTRRSQAQERKIRKMGLRGLQAILESLVKCGQKKAPPATPAEAISPQNDADHLSLEQDPGDESTYDLSSVTEDGEQNHLSSSSSSSLSSSSSAAIMVPSPAAGMLSPMPAVSPDEYSGGKRNAQQFSSPIGKDAVEVFDRKQRLKEERERGILQFNLKPAKGLAFLEERGHFKHEPREVAKFLHQFRDSLDKTVIGDFLGKEKEYKDGFCVRVLHEYIDMMQFAGMKFDDAIRHFLSGFRLPGEAQKIDRMMEKFAERYCTENPKSVFPSPDTAFVLAFSIIMLNTDAHNPAITADRKMTREGFRRQVEGIANGGNLPDDFLDGIYERITANAISLKDDDALRQRESTRSSGSSDIAEALSVFGATPVEKRRRAAFASEREDMVKAGESLFYVSRRTKQQQLLQQQSDAASRAAGNGVTGEQSGGGALMGQNIELASFQRLTAEDVQDLYVRPMFAVAWGPIVGALSHTLEAASCSGISGQGANNSSGSSQQEIQAAADGTEVVDISLATMLDAIHLAASLGMATARATLINGLAKFTTLDGVREMKPLHVECVKALLRVAVDDGQYLGESWEPVLQCVSRLNRLQLTASGAAGDDFFFSPSPTGLSSGIVHGGPGGTGKHGDGGNATSDMFGKMFGSSSSSYSIAAEAASAVEQSNAEHLLQAVDSLALKIDHIFAASTKLDSEAIQHFVKHLSAVAALELHGGGTKSLRGWEVLGDSGSGSGIGSGGAGGRVDGVSNTGFAGTGNLEDGIITTVSNGSTVADPTISTPRVFSLQKLVEVADFNMDIRPRIIWSSVWGVLSNHFTAAGLHPNPKVAMYAIDSLRQLSVKFLSKDELRDFSFQRLFLKPFEGIMRGSNNKDIRELVVLSVDSMVQARLQQLRSGWKTMLTVLSLGASKSQHGDVVQLSFKCLKRLVASDFDLLVFDFTEVINALLRFASLDDTRTALEAIALVKNCATHLGNGRVAAVMARLQGERSMIDERPTLNGASIAIDDNQWQLWWPLLYGLSQSVDDQRVEVRKSALGALGGTLVEFGGAFSEETWRLVFKGIIFPVMESAWTDGTPHSQQSSTFPAQSMDMDEESESAASSFILTTAKQVFQVCIDLFKSFPDVANTLLHETLSLLTESICQEIETLARGATAALHKLVLSMPLGAAPSLWDMLCEALSAVTCRPLPSALVGPHLTAEATIDDNYSEANANSTEGSDSNIGVDVSNNNDTVGSEGESINVENHLVRRGILTQLVVTLLMQDVLESLLEVHYLDLSATHMRTIMDALLSTATTARQFHAEVDLRKGLRARKLMFFPHRGSNMQLPHLVEQESKAYDVLLNALSRLLTVTKRDNNESYSGDGLMPPFGIAAATTQSGASPLSSASSSSFSTTYFVKVWLPRIQKDGFIYQTNPAKSNGDDGTLQKQSARVFAHELSAIEVSDWFPEGKNFLLEEGADSINSGDFIVTSWPSGEELNIIPKAKFQTQYSAVRCFAAVTGFSSGSPRNTIRTDSLAQTNGSSSFATFVVARLTYTFQVVLDEYALKDGRAGIASARAHVASLSAYGNGSGDAAALEEETHKMIGTVVQVLRCLTHSEDEYLMANMNWLMGSLCELVRCRDDQVRIALHKVMVQKIAPLLTG